MWRRDFLPTARREKGLTASTLRCGDFFSGAPGINWPLGGVTIFVVVYLLGYALVLLVHKIIGLRVDLAEETNGLDWSETGALGYQGDPEPED